MEKGDAGKKHFKAKKGKTRDYWTRDYNYQLFSLTFINTIAELADF